MSKKADGPNWQVILLIGAVVFLVLIILLYFTLSGNLSEGSNIITNLLRIF